MCGWGTKKSSENLGCINKKKVDRGKQKLKQLCSHVLEIKSDGDDKHMGIDMKKNKTYFSLTKQYKYSIQLVWSNIKKLHPTKTKLIKN